MSEIFRAVGAPDYMGPKSVHDLEIWRDSIALMKSIYLETRSWPREETYGLIARARRASVSIPANLAEGRSRGNPAEMRRFGHIALGSAYELDTLLVIATELGYAATESIRAQLEVLMRRIQSFIGYQESKIR